VAVSLLLLIGSGLVSRSLEAARRANPGFDAGQVAAVSINVRQNRYDEARGRVFYRQLLDTARADSGVEAATLAAYNPMGLLDTPARGVAIEGYEPRRGEDLAFLWNAIGPDYFRVLQALDAEEWNGCHAAIAALAKAGLVAAIVTTNFDRLLERALEPRRVDPRVRLVDEAPQQVPVALGVERVGSALARQRIQPLELHVSQVVAVHRDVRHPVGAAGRRDTTDHGFGEGRLAGARHAGDAEHDSPAVTDDVDRRADHALEAHPCSRRYSSCACTESSAAGQTLRGTSAYTRSTTSCAVCAPPATACRTWSSRSARCFR